VAELPENVTVSITPATAKTAETTAELAATFKAIGGALKQAAEPFKITAQMVAKAFDVPLEVLMPVGTPDYPAQVAAIKAAAYPPPKLPINASGPVMVSQLDEHGAPTGKLIELGKVSDFSFNYAEGGIITPEQAKAAGESLLKKHQITFAVDLGADASKDTVVAAMTSHFEPPDEYLHGDGDIPLYQPKPFVFNVLGKAQPVVVHSPPQQVWQNELGVVTKIDSKMSRVDLVGTVSTAAGYHKLALTLVTEHELAHRLLTETDPAKKIQMGVQFVNGMPFTWEAGTGWVPKEQEPARYGWFCDACQVHWNAHTGDPVACESGGYVRQATSAEHKLMLLHS
jgi:hypothetical protein